MPARRFRDHRWPEARGQVASLSITDSGDRKGAAADAATPVWTSIPDAPTGEKADAALALASLLQASNPSSITVRGVRFSASCDAIRFTLTATAARN